MANRIARWLTGLACLVAASVAAWAKAPVALGTDQPVAGRSQEEWSRLWWVWASGFPEKGEGPLTDRTGAHCAKGQDGPVWFLASAHGGPVKRACDAPAGKHLFFPLISLIAFGPTPGQMDCPTMKSAMRLNADDPDELFFEIDGVAVGELKSLRLASAECFKVGNFDGSPGRDMVAATDGYFAMLAPLPPGRHTIRFGGRFTMVKQDVTYVLEVR